MASSKYDDPNVTLDADEDDWEWRRRIRANPHTHRIYRIVVGVVGGIVLAAGIVAIPFPGPGWLIVFLGLGIWASEFEWAQQVLERVRDRVRSWDRWIRSQHLVVQGLFALATFAFVLGVLWTTLHLSGVPTLLPDPAETWLHRVPGL